MSSSDSDSDLSDIPAVDSLFPKRRKYEGDEEEDEEEQSNHRYDQQKQVKEIGSDDDESCGGSFIQHDEKKRVVLSQESETMKKIVFQDDSDESENEMDSEQMKKKKETMTTTTTTTNVNVNSQKSAPTKQDIKILDDSDDSDNDISSSALNVMNNAFLDQARKARIELDMMPHIDLLSDDDLHDTVIHDNNRTRQESNPKPNTDPTTRSVQDYVQVITQVKGGDASIRKIYQLKLHDPFSKLVATYKKERGYSSFRRISFELVFQKNDNKIMELDQYKSPHELGIHDQCLLLVHDEEQRIKQLRNNPNCAIVGESHASSIGTDGVGTTTASSNHLHFGNGILSIKVRINGNDKTIQNYKMNPTEPFQKLIQLVCSNNGGIDSRECKFIFEGMALNPNSTPEDEDLEGDEMIDVSIDEMTLAKMDQKKREQSPPSLESNVKCVSTTDTPAPAPAGQNNQKAKSRQIVEVLIIRNHEKNQPKKFKLYNTDTVNKLMKGYIATYKKKGCKSVKFYLRKHNVDTSSTIDSLGLQSDDRILALENGRKM